MHVPTLLSTITAIDKLFLRFSAIKALDLLLFLWFFVVARSSVNSGSGSGWTSKRLMPKTTVQTEDGKIWEYRGTAPKLGPPGVQLQVVKVRVGNFSGSH